MTTLADLLQLHNGITSVRIERWVSRGLLRPLGETDDWTFEQIDVARVRLLAELGDDIGLDEDTVEAIVGLIDHVHTLRGQLELLARAIAEQPAATREAIAAVLQRLSDRR